MEAYVQTEFQKYSHETSQDVSLLSYIALARAAGIFLRSVSVIYDFYNRIFFIASTVT